MVGGMELTKGQIFMLLWLGTTSLVTFLLFGWDKWRATRQGRRIGEGTLWLISAFGGWPGGLLGMFCFRHKTSKFMFLLEFGAALVVWITLVSGAWHLIGRS